MLDCCRLPVMETNGKFEVDVRDVEYQSLAGKPWLARVYQPKGIRPISDHRGRARRRVAQRRSD